MERRLRSYEYQDCIVYVFRFSGMGILWRYYSGATVVRVRTAMCKSKERAVTQTRCIPIDMCRIFACVMTAGWFGRNARCCNGLVKHCPGLVNGLQVTRACWSSMVHGADDAGCRMQMTVFPSFPSFDKAMGSASSPTSSTSISSRAPRCGGDIVQYTRS
jgi:hypothetical protein